MTSLQPIDQELWEVPGQVRLGPGIIFPCRMVIARQGDALWLHSPVDLTLDAMAQIEALGQVRWLVAPNTMHHLFMAQAQQRWPGAQVWGPQALHAKRPDLRWDWPLERAQDEAPWAATLAPIPILGAPAISEWAFWHQATRSLLVTDLCFHLSQAPGALTPWLLRAVGVWGALAQSRLWRGLIKDRAAAAASAERLLALKPERLIMAHGQILHAGATPALEAALWRMRGRSGRPPAQA